MSLTVLEPGPLSLVVDLGRPHHRSFGVPFGGAADRAAYMQGNALVGNEPGAAALEFAFAGPTLRAEADRAHNRRTPAYLLGIPLLSDYLEEALSLFGCSCEDYEMNRL